MIYLMIGTIISFVGMLLWTYNEAILGYLGMLLFIIGAAIALKGRREIDKHNKF